MAAFDAGSADAATALPTRFDAPPPSSRPEPEAVEPGTVERRQNVTLGIFYMIGASLFFALTSALSKWQVAVYPVGEVMFMRSAATFVTVIVFTLPRTGFGVFRTTKPGAHLARGLSQSASQTFSVLAFWLMPLAGAIAINFSAPLWASLLSLFLLRERPGAARWTALLVGFLGVVVVASPGLDSLQLGAVFALANAVMYGSVTVAVRGMTKTESSSTLLVWQVSTVLAFHAVLLVFGFRLPTGLDLALMTASGVTNACAQYGWTKALSLAPTAAVSPFYYLTLVWAVLIGLFVWNEIPSVGLVFGAVVVCGSGLFLVWNESRKQHAARR